MYQLHRGDLRNFSWLDCLYKLPCRLLFPFFRGFCSLHFDLRCGHLLCCGGFFVLKLRSRYISSKQLTVQLLDLLCGFLLRFSGSHGLHEL